jgi:hypothetical protein
MNTQPLVYLSREIEAALEAVMVPALILLVAVFVIAAAAEIRARRGDELRRRESQSFVRTRGRPAQGPGLSEARYG